VSKTTERQTDHAAEKCVAIGGIARARAIPPNYRVTAVTVRLVGGSSDSEGRLELYHGGVWGTVCDDYFNDVAATVVCNSLARGSVIDISLFFLTYSLISLTMLERQATAAPTESFSSCSVLCSPCGLLNRHVE